MGSNTQKELHELVAFVEDILKDIYESIKNLEVSKQTNSVHCNLCGKEINPNTSYYLARRSATVRHVQESFENWEYFGVAPLFYACCFEHYSVLFMDWKQRLISSAVKELGETAENYK